MEELQTAFSKLYCKEQPLSIELAGELAEHLVVARFNQMIGSAHRIAKEENPDLDGFPILSTAHDWDVPSPSQ